MTMLNKKIQQFFHVELLSYNEIKHKFCNVPIDTHEKAMKNQSLLVYI